MAEDLLTSIFRCPNVDRCIHLPDGAEHPCKEIVDLQSSSSVVKHDLPEPWQGQLDSAPVLIIGLNPNIGTDANYPTYDSSDSYVRDYFNNHFGGGQATWVAGGTSPISPEGTVGAPVPTWKGVLSRVAELFGVDSTEVRPGIDYAITDAVHCKSKRGRGVGKALDKCGSRYLDQILELSPATVVIVMGGLAHTLIKRRFGIKARPGDVWSEVGSKVANRTYVFLHHPTARAQYEKSLYIVGRDVVQRLRKLIPVRR